MKNELRQLGLSENEVDAYLKLLSSGEVPVSVLAYKMKLPRNTCRYVCHQLIDKNLVSTRKDGNTFLFRAEPADKLYYLIEQQKSDLEKKEEGLNRIINELKAVEDPNSILPKVTYTNGINELEKAYEQFFDLLPNDAVIYDYVSTFDDDFPIERDRIIDLCVRKRKEKNLHIKCISTNTDPAQILKYKDPEENRETFLVKKIFDNGFEMMVCEDIIFEAFFTPPNCVARITQNKSLAEMQLHIMKLAFEGAKGGL